LSPNEVVTYKDSCPDYLAPGLLAMYTFSKQNDKLLVNKVTEPQYAKVMTNMDRGGADIGCYDNGEPADFCKEKCNNDPNCKAYN